MPYDIAGSQILAQPVSAFLQGRAIKRAEQESDVKMKALERAEAREEEQLTMAKEDRQVQYDQVTAKKSLAGAQQVLAVPKGERKKFVEANFPDLVAKLEEQEYGWGEVDEDEVEEMARNVMAQSSAALGISPEKPTAQSKEGKVAMDVKSNILTAEQGKAALAPKNTTDFDNFVAAQKDPAFGQFLKEKRGKGFSMTLPDGTVIEMGGEGSKVDPGELSKPTINNLQDTIVKSTDRLDRLNATLRNYNPDFLRAHGLLTAASTRAKDFLGMNVPDEQRQYLDEYSQFQSSAATDLAQFLKDMSGAAVTPQEYARTEKALPSGKEVSPIEFEAKAKVATKTITRAIMRANWALKNGIGVSSVEQLAKVMPLESVDNVYEQRANEIWQELGGTPEKKAEAIKRANQEFGLAR